MAQLVERTAQLEISPPVAAPSATLDAAIARASPPEAAEAAPSPTLDVDAIAQAIQATGYCVVDDALGKTHAEQLGAACRAVKKAPATIQEGTDRVNDKKRRDDAVAFLKDSKAPPIQKHRAAMEGLRLQLNNLLNLKTDACSFMCACYKAGASGYVKHRDSAPTKPSGRKLTAIYYLNPSWHATAAGELRLWDACGGVRLLEPRNDRLVVFRSSLEHEVLSTKIDRLALTTWFFNRLELGLELIKEKRDARQDLFECERGCGFRGRFADVERHEETCKYVA